jgi:hypothetical protein
MENSTTTIEKLIEKAEIYSKTTFELCKYNTIYKAADVFSSLAIKLVITIVLVLFSLMLNVGIALWIGQLLGNSYYGFFVIAAVYLFIGLVIYLFRVSWIKKPLSNLIISQSLKKN